MQQSARTEFAKKSAQTRQRNGWFKRCGSSAVCLNKGSAIGAALHAQFENVRNEDRAASTLLRW